LATGRSPIDQTGSSFPNRGNPDEILLASSGTTNNNPIIRTISANNGSAARVKSVTSG
jgi:hypothetical protein